MSVCGLERNGCNFGSFLLKKGKILSLVLLVLFCAGEYSAFAGIPQDRQRIEFTQWYTDWGERDAFEIIQYNAEGLRTSHVVLLNDRVIDSSFILYDEGKIITYDLEGQVRSITETVGNKETHYYYFNGEPRWKTECILHKDKRRYIYYHPDDVIDEMYDEIVLDNNCKLLKWLDSEDEKVVREEVIIEEYDYNGLLVYRESREYKANGVTTIIREYSYDVIYDEKERPVLINRFALDNNGKQLIYSRRIEYADKKLE